MEYRQILKDELSRRVAANSRYSMRTFARSMEVSPAFLSKVLRAQKNLSLEKAIRFSRLLGFSETETRRFCSSVRGGSDLEGVLKTAETHPVSQLDIEKFALIADWHHYAILFLTECRGFNPDPAAVGKRLGISTATAATAIKRMLTLGLLKVERGRLKRSDTYIATPSGTASQAIRSFHKQMLQKAMTALEQQDMTERDITGMTFAIHPEKIPEAKEAIKKFRRSLAKLLDTGRPTVVYQLNVQFFKLTEEK